jgi:hypothetical protein
MESWGYNWADVLKVTDLFVSKQANLMTLNFNVQLLGREEIPRL